MCHAATSKLLGWKMQLRLSVMIALLLAMVLSIQAADAAAIGWHQDLTSAARTAARQEKPLLVVVGARWCGYCQQLQQQTLRDPAVAQRVAADFVPVMIDADAQPGVTQQLDANQLPTVLVLSPDLRVLQRMTGFQSAAELNSRLAAYRPARPARVPPTRAVPAVRARQPVRTSFWRSHSSTMTLSAATSFGAD